MKIESGTYCPLIKKDCVQFKCMFWTQLRGTHPQTGQPVDEWDCAVKWLPLLLIENTKETMYTTASIDKLRVESDVKTRLQNLLEKEEEEIPQKFIDVDSAEV